MSRYALKIVMKTAKTFIMNHAKSIAPYSTSRMLYESSAPIGSTIEEVPVLSQSAKFLSTATNSLVEEKYEDAARNFIQWLKIEGISDQIAKKSFDPTTSKKTKYLPDVLSAFLSCPCDDGCKDHIIEIAKVLAEVSDFRGNTALHIIAESRSEGNDKVYKDLIALLLDTPDKIAKAIAAKNSLGQNFIDVAVLYKNEKFIEALKDENKLPDNLPFDNIGFYRAIEDEGADLEIYDMLGTQHPVTELV